MVEDNKVNLGEFEVVSGRMIVSDPCYAENLWCCDALENVRNGVWNAYAIYDNDGSYPLVAALAVEHERAGDDAADDDAANKEEASFAVGVDSGQAGFFDASHYRDDKVIDPNCTPTEQADLWYDHCAQITLSRQQAGILPFGAVSSSGYGDGAYACYLRRDAVGYVIRAEILFIESETDDEFDE